MNFVSGYQKTIEKGCELAHCIARLLLVAKFDVGGLLEIGELWLNTIEIRAES